MTIYMGTGRRLSAIRQVVTDARSGWNEPLGERLRAEIRDMAGRA